ncbi:S8 family serine peptidase [Sphingobacterium sp. N143]|uniref:S8 family serine peptidase n=1 Tax=Sphingobacterium sp. N143 TaxID=2746727 RepID=UPI0025769646|nr:S8 family serine peptidase [Sphingobacterium sp. N143]MDM1295890.1 S8 family serine peptidase [Sphingobacterium sp. N143]
MNRRLPHLYLRNPFGVVNKFKKDRGIEKTDLIDQNPEAYRNHKQKLNGSFNQLLLDREKRLRNKTLINVNIDIVEIRFLIPFSNGVNFKTRTKFLNEFGLTAVMLEDFNRTVLFAVENQAKFNEFHRTLLKYINSSNQTSPKNTDYAIMTTIYDIKYHTADDIRNHCSDDLILELINNTVPIFQQYDHQKGALKERLEDLKRLGSLQDFKFDPYEKMVQLEGIESSQLNLLVNNFDILAQGHSLRSVAVRPNQYNQEELTWNLRIAPKNRSTTIGVIDNGIRRIQPIEAVMLDEKLDITNTQDGHQAIHTHGTVVASLAAVGESFFSGDRNIEADAKIFSIKILEDLNGYIDVVSVVEAIRQANLVYGVHIFNLSVCAQSKRYNEAPSHFAYLLDKLSYELNILIFIAAGNMPYDDLQGMQAIPSQRHQYPFHFYNPPENEMELHNCVYTNICIPAESINNITVGAQAENFRSETRTDLSLDKNLAAYYSRKNHYDFKQKINGGELSINHSNKNLFKPDILMPGGDLLTPESSMQVIGFGELGSDFYAFDAGTSLASPLAANLAAKLLNTYPEISIQSVKALLINSAENYPSNYLDELIKVRKDELAIEKYGIVYNKLTSKSKTNITNSVISADDLHRNLSGYGKPNVEQLLYSKENTVSILIEDSIQQDHHKVILVKIPDYLLEGKGNGALDIKATLCFKTNPAWGNHVDYNPLHISFNFANSLIKNSIDELANVLADRDHDLYERYWTPKLHNLKERMQSGSLTEGEIKQFNLLKGVQRNKILGVKSKIQSWSEDFFPLVNKPLSNRQQHSIKINKNELRKIGNQLAIVMRCAIKENLDTELSEWARTTRDHQFSLALYLEDKSNNPNGNLYEELNVVNILEAIPNVIGDLDQEADLDA